MNAKDQENLLMSVSYQNVRSGWSNFTQIFCQPRKI